MNRGRFRIPARILTAVLALSLCLSATYAQKGKISGRVFDAEMEDPLPGANIIVTHRYESGKAVEIAEKQGAASGTDGYFVILNVPPGTYDIRAEMIGYSPLVLRQVRVNLDLTTTVEFPLAPTILEGEVVEVVARREIIRRDVSGTQEVIQTQRIEETPVVRMDEFINKIKGVDLVAGEEGQGLSIRGGDIRETDIRIDGISLRDPRSENSYLNLNTTAVEELQVLTGGFEAKYGGIRSGLVNVVTKDGSREKYSISLKFDYTPSNQYKYFGEDPWSHGSDIYRFYADTTFGYIDPADSSFHSFAMEGYPRADSLLPEGFPVLEGLRSFKGWNNPRQPVLNQQQAGIPPGTRLTPEQKRKLWAHQHPAYDYAGRPDQFIEGSITGPLPGKWLPLIGPFMERSTFLLAGKYENTQFAFPIAPTNDYLDWNTQLKITTRLSPNTKLSLNGMYAAINTVTAGRPSNFGGALIDNSSRFNFLSSTEVSVNQQARLLAGAAGFTHMYNQSRLQFYDQRHIMTGAKLSQNLSTRAYYTLEFQFNYADHQISPFALDTSEANAWVHLDSTLRVLNVPAAGSPNASTNFGYDITDLFALYGGLQQADTSYSWVANLRGNLTAQIGRHHEVETGFQLKYNYLSVNSGTWAQAQQSWTPDTWQYFTASPLELGVYLQDKLEFQGMVANVGLRMDYFHPLEQIYTVNHPLDKDYADFYNITYQYLPGDFGSWEKWVEYRERLGNPPGWPTKRNPGQLKFSPRLGVSFPITVNSKLFFNYGHFYQRPNIHFLYNRSIMPGATIVPSTGLAMARTVAYEFGFEQRFLRQFLINISAYYKKVEDEPLSRTYVDYYEEMHVSRYFPDAFEDIRGVELRLEKSAGRFLTFWGNYEYLLQSSGRTGLARVYENRLKADQEARWANVVLTQPHPRAQGNINLHSPGDFGPGVAGVYPLGGIYINLFGEWQDGGEQIINPQEPEPEQKKIEVVDYTNLDLRVSKAIPIAGVNFEIVATIQNLLNQKRLAYWNMSITQYDRYRESLHLPFEEGEHHGNDKLGEYQKEHIDIGWFTAPLFLNPRRVLLGLRINF